MISIVIPAYNAEQTIVRTLDSVFAQTYSNLEVVVVDDASTDGTVEAVKSRLRSFNDDANANRETNHPIIQSSNLVLLRMEQNSGPAAARNRGIKEAKGEWIAFLDADDAWLPEKMEMQMNLAAEHPDVSMFCGDTLSLEPEEQPARNAAHSAAGGRTTVGSREMLLSDFAVGNLVATSTVLIKKEALDSVGGFDEQFKGPEDYDLWMRVAGKHRILKMNIPLSWHRIETGSLSMDDRQFLPEVLRVLEKAFSEGGALWAHRENKRIALATQYWCASWMAFNRGGRRTALRYWFKSFMMCPSAEGRGIGKQLSLLMQYLVGNCG